MTTDTPTAEPARPPRIAGPLCGGSLARRLGRRLPRVRALLAHAAVLAALGTPVAAQCELAEMAATDFGSLAGVSHYDRMGIDCDISGPAVLVGAFGANTIAGADSGVVWAYRHDGDAFVAEEKIRASDATTNAYFGWKLAVEGDMAVIRGQDQYYTFLYNANNGKWVEQAAKLPGVAGDDELDLDDGVLAICNNSVDDEGHVRVHRWSGSAWQLEQTIPNPEPDDFPAFGVSVAIDGEAIVAGGLRLMQSPDEPNGAAWIYRFDGSTWQQEQRLTGALVNDSLYGSVVAIDGDTVAVTASGTTMGGGVGVVYVYERVGGTWGGLQVLEPELQVMSYGASLAIEGDLLVVGAPVHNLSFPFAGALYAYHRDGGTWSLDHTILPAGAAHSDSLGASVAIDGGIVVGGADCKTVSGFDCAGGAWVYDLNSRADVHGEGLAGFGGLVPDLSISDSLCPGETVSFSLTDARPLAAATLVLGLTAVDAPFKGGTLVPAPQVLVPGLPVDGLGDLIVGLTWPDDFPSSVPLFWQYVVPDVDAPFGFALSNGVETVSGGL